MATQQPRYMDGSEIRLARHWWEEDDVSVAEIARRLRRSPSSLWRLFGGEASASKGVGRKAKLTDLDKDRLEKLVASMVKKSNTQYIVTVLSLTSACSVRAKF